MYGVSNTKALNPLHPEYSGCTVYLKQKSELLAQNPLIDTQQQICFSMQLQQD